MMLLICVVSWFKSRLVAWEVLVVTMSAGGEDLAVRYAFRDKKLI